ncbi:MAG: accessory factor UbiK family protein [Betaproteobacteria bacterium]|nr:accessory factor UbiK family protein [Betaproteobacteria bacterium]
MAIPDPLNELAQRLREAGANSPLADIEKNSRALFTNVLGKLDLVTREEFDAQARVLARTREKLEALERRVQEMETAAGAKSPAD